MNYVLFTVKGKDYKLVLTTRTMVELEKRLNGRNPISILMDVADDKLSTITEMILILWCSVVKALETDREIEAEDGVVY